MSGISERGRADLCRRPCHHAATALRPVSAPPRSLLPGIPSVFSLCASSRLLVLRVRPMSRPAPLVRFGATWPTTSDQASSLRGPGPSGAGAGLQPRIVPVQDTIHPNPDDTATIAPITTTPSRSPRHKSEPTAHLDACTPRAGPLLVRGGRRA